MALDHVHICHLHTAKDSNVVLLNDFIATLLLNAEDLVSARLEASKAA